MTDLPQGAGETGFFTKRPIAAPTLGKKPGFFGLA